MCFESYEMYFYEWGIKFDIEDMVIDGEGKTLDGADKSWIFLISANNVVLKNITFKNARAFLNNDICEIIMERQLKHDFFESFSFNIF